LSSIRWNFELNGELEYTRSSKPNQLARVGCSRSNAKLRIALDRCDQAALNKVS